VRATDRSTCSGTAQDGRVLRRVCHALQRRIVQHSDDRQPRQRADFTCDLRGDAMLSYVADNCVQPHVLQTTACNRACCRRLLGSTDRRLQSIAVATPALWRCGIALPPHRRVPQSGFPAVSDQTRSPSSTASTAAHPIGHCTYGECCGRVLTVRPRKVVCCMYDAVVCCNGWCCVLQRLPSCVACTMPPSRSRAPSRPPRPDIPVWVLSSDNGSVGSK
jgi:hypothetical protein